MVTENSQVTRPSPTGYGGEECCLCPVIGSTLVVTENSQVTSRSHFTFMPSAQASLLCLVGFLQLINWLEYSMEGLWRQRNLQFGGCTLVDLQSLQDFLDWWRNTICGEYILQLNFHLVHKLLVEHWVIPSTKIYHLNSCISSLSSGFHPCVFYNFCRLLSLY